MSDDGNDDVITLESQDIEIQELPEFPDREEFVKTQEMDSPPGDMPRRDHVSTRPMQPVLDKTTQRYDVPDSLLEQARRTHRGEEETPWIEFEAQPDKHGRIQLPKQLRGSLGRAKLEIRVRVAKPSDE